VMATVFTSCEKYHSCLSGINNDSARKTICLPLQTTPEHDGKLTIVKCEIEASTSLRIKEPARDVVCQKSIHVSEPRGKPDGLYHFIQKHFRKRTAYQNTRFEPKEASSQERMTETRITEFRCATRLKHILFLL